MTNPSFLGWKLSQKTQHTGEILYLREPPTSLMLKPFLRRSHKTICYATLRTSNNPLIYSIHTCNNKPPFWTALVNIDLIAFSYFSQHLNLLFKRSVLWLWEELVVWLPLGLGLQRLLWFSGRWYCSNFLMPASCSIHSAYIGKPMFGSMYLENVAPKVKEEDKGYVFKLLSKILKVSVTFERPFLQ